MDDKKRIRELENVNKAYAKHLAVLVDTTMPPAERAEKIVETRDALNRAMFIADAPRRKQIAARRNARVASRLL